MVDGNDTFWEIVGTNPISKMCHVKKWDRIVPRRNNLCKPETCPFVFESDNCPSNMDNIVRGPICQVCHYRLPACICTSGYVGVTNV